MLHSKNIASTRRRIASGDGLIPNYRSRLLNSGAGISPRSFLVRVVWPLLTTLEISREEMKNAMKKHGLVTVSNCALKLAYESPGIAVRSIFGKPTSIGERVQRNTRSGTKENRSENRMEIEQHG